MLSSECDDRKCRVLLHEGVRIWEHAIYPLRESGWSCSAAIPPGCLTSEILLRCHFIRIFYIRRLTPNGRGEAFQLPRLDISRSSDSAYPESFAAIFCTVPQCSPKASRYVQPTFWDILRYFALDILCLNSQTLLVTHQLEDSLVIKFGKRINKLIYIIIVIFHINISREPVLGETTHLLYSFQRKKNTELCSALPSHFDCIFLLAKQALRMFPQRMSG